MGIIAKYKQYQENRRKKGAARSLKTIKNPKAIKEDRSSAIDYLSHFGDASVAVPALLQRFEYSLEHGINDTREKEAAMNGILNYSNEALIHIENHLKQSIRIAWPIKTFRALADEAATISTLEACLDYNDVAFDQSRVDKNYDILCYLRDYKLGPEHCEKIVHYLGQHDERLRFAAVELLLEQENENISPALEKFLLDDSPENSRIRQCAIQGFARNKWMISDKQKFKVGPLAHGTSINSQFQVVRQA